jgi:hypothetical protein
MPVAFTNQASTTLAGGISAVATSLTLATTTGANFPATSGNQWFYLTLVDKLTNWTKYEIVKVTTRVGDTCSVIVRAQDGTTAQTWNSGDFVQLRLTKGTFADLTVQYANNADNLSNLSNFATARTNLGLGTMATQNANAVAITGGTLSGVALTSSSFNGPIGTTTPDAGFFTTLTASGQIISTLATGTAPLSVASTTVVGNLNVSQLLGFTWNAPGAIGSVTPNSGAFTTLSASGAVSGAGFTAYLASPPAIGGGAPAAGTFTSLNAQTIRATTSINNRGLDNASATNSGFGEGVLAALAGGTGNTAVGNRSQAGTTTGTFNTAVGADSMLSNTTGLANSAIGATTLSFNTTGARNCAMGVNTMFLNQTGNNNTVLGWNGMQFGPSNSSNVAVGDGTMGAAGVTVTAGSFVVGVSYTIQTSGTTNFTIIGAANNAPGTIFVATGVGLGTGTASSNTSFNIAIGSSALNALTTGNNNVAVGYRAGYAAAGSATTTGDNNIFIGRDTIPAAATDANSIVIGNSGLGLGSNTTVLGNSSTTRTKIFGSIEAPGRTFGTQGAAVASANNLSLGTDGNYFQITGNTQINLLEGATWTGGSIVTMKFNSTPTVKHNQAVSGANKPILLAGAVDFVATANDTLTLRYDSTDAVWYEMSRAVI